MWILKLYLFLYLFLDLFIFMFIFVYYRVILYDYIIGNDWRFYINYFICICILKLRVDFEIRGRSFNNGDKITCGIMKVEGVI